MNSARPRVAKADACVRCVPGDVEFLIIVRSDSHRTNNVVARGVLGLRLNTEGIEPSRVLGNFQRGHP